MKERYQMRSKTLIIIALLLVLLQIGICTWLYNYTPPQMTSSDTVVQVQFDTVETIKDTTITKFVPKEIKIIKTDTITKDTIINTERKTYIDTLCNDKDSIILKSSITGINVKIDSLQAEWKKQKEIITQTNTVTKYIEKPRKKIGFGVSAGYGIGLKSKEFEPFIGLGVSLNL